MNYTYTGHRVSCSNSVCPYTKSRHAVTSATVEDGLGHVAATTYYFGPARQLRRRMGRSRQRRRFPWFQGGADHHLRHDAPATVLRWEKLESFDSGAAAARDNPDPRRGKLRRREVRATANAPTPLAVYTYDWRAYWLENGAWSTTATELSYKEVGDALLSPRHLAAAGKDNPNPGCGDQRTALQPMRASTAIGQSRATTPTAACCVPPSLTTPPTHGLYRDRPARSRIFAGSTESGACVQEIRTLYDHYGTSYQTPPQRGLVYQSATGHGRLFVRPGSGRHRRWLDHHPHTYDGGTPRFGNRTRTEVIGAARCAGDGLRRRLLPLPHPAKCRRVRGKRSLLWRKRVAPEQRQGLLGGHARILRLNGLCTRQSYDEFGRPLRQWTSVAD